MALYPPARLNVTWRTHSRRRAISGGTGRRPLAYERTEPAERPSNFASSASPRSRRNALIASWSMAESYGVPRSSSPSTVAARRPHSHGHWASSRGPPRLWVPVLGKTPNYVNFIKPPKRPA
jgi:hypothetical protein